jgi:hypothetical protein
MEKEVILIGDDEMAKHAEIDTSRLAFKATRSIRINRFLQLIGDTCKMSYGLPYRINVDAVLVIALSSQENNSGIGDLGENDIACDFRGEVNIIRSPILLSS